MAMALDSGQMNTMKALSALNIRLTTLNELLETEQYGKIIELFEEALKERIKQWKLKQLTRFRDKDQVEMRTIHEAYQYLFKRFVDDAAKNTVENKRATLRLTIKEINTKFSELTEDDIKKYSDMKKVKKNEETMIAMQNVPKKSLAKKAKKILAKTLSETRLKIVTFDENSSSEDEGMPVKKNPEENLEENFDIQGEDDQDTMKGIDELEQIKKSSSSKRNSKEKLEISPKLTEYDKLEGSAFVESRRGSMDKSKVPSGVGGKSINPLKGDEIKKVTIAKKSMAKMASKTRKKSKSRSKDKIQKANENPLEDFPLDHEFESNVAGGFTDELSKKLYKMLGNVSLNEDEDQVPTTPRRKQSGFERR